MSPRSPLGSGCPVVPLVASRGDGVAHLRAEIDRVAGERRIPKVDLGYGPEVEHALGELEPMLERVVPSPSVDVQWLAIKLLEGDEGARAMVPASVRQAAVRIAEQTADRADEDCDILIADSRYGFANALVRETVRREGVVRRTVSDRIDRVVLHRLAGIPIFLAVMYLLFLFTINFGSAFIDFFDQFAGTLLVDGAAQLLDGMGSPPWLTALLANGVGGGVQTVATFIPIIACLYLFLSALEDSGYMARAAFVMDRLMRSVGLPGKSFIPLIVGFGCNVPAIMATRTLENRRDRILTVMMAPFMSCGARLPVYALFAAAMFPTGGQNLVFALYLIGIGFAVMTGLVLKKTLLQGRNRAVRHGTAAVPSADAARHSVAHLGAAAGVPVPGRPGDRRRRRRAQLLQQLGNRRLVRQPGHRALGARRRRQVDHARAGADGRQRGQLAGDGRHAHRHSRQGDGGGNPERAVQLAGGRRRRGRWRGRRRSTCGAESRRRSPRSRRTSPNWRIASLDPLGLNIVQTGDLQAAAEAQEVDVGTFGAMASRFDGQIGAFAYLLAVLLYMPCVSAIAAIYRETGPRWAVFASLWTTGLGYGAAVLAYPSRHLRPRSVARSGMDRRHPAAVRSDPAGVSHGRRAGGGAAAAAATAAE